MLAKTCVHAACCLSFSYAVSHCSQWESGDIGFGCVCGWGSQGSRSCGVLLLSSFERCSVTCTRQLQWLQRKLVQVWGLEVHCCTSLQALQGWLTAAEACIYSSLLLIMRGKGFSRCMLLAAAWRPYFLQAGLLCCVACKCAPGARCCAVAQALDTHTYSSLWTMHGELSCSVCL